MKKSIFLSLFLVGSLKAMIVYEGTNSTQLAVMKSWGGMSKVPHHNQGDMIFSTKLLTNEALLTAVKEGCLFAIEDALAKGADLQAQDGEAEIVELLLRKGADLNVQNESGETPLHIAAEKGKIKRVTLLLKGGANTKMRTRDGWFFKGITAAELAHGATKSFLLKWQQDRAYENEDKVSL